MKTRHLIKLSIRKKLLLSSLLLLLIPWMGYQSIQNIENDLRIEQEKQLLNRAKLVSVVLEEQQNLFSTEKLELPPENDTQSINHVYVRQLSSAIQLDGYTNDWNKYNDRFRLYESKEATSSLSFEHQIGNYKRYLYVIFKVTDDKIIYRRPGSFQLNKSDHLRINLINKKGDLQQFIITTQTPGWVTAHRLIRDSEPVPEVRIKGEWQETETGYNIEIRIPLKMIGNMISFAIADVDDANTREIIQLTGTADPDNPYALASIIVPSPVVELLLKKVHQGTTRTWVIDQNYRVIAVVGNLTKNQYNTDDNDSGLDASRTTQTQKSSSFLQYLMRLFYQSLLTQPNSHFTDDLSSASVLTGNEFKAALSGQPATQWRTTPDTDVNILTVTHPIVINDQVVGAIAIEETNASILILQNRAFEILINLSILTFLIATTVLILFASRLSSRIRRLRNDADNAIASDGRVKGRIKATNSTDEIGDLSRSFSEMLNRLTQYNRYLETMASKLSHELRTPITVVRSSLDNLELKNNPSDSPIILKRAREGLNRLNNILTRMSEATRLEQTLHNEEKIPFKLDDVIGSCIEGYSIANPEITFEFNTDNKDYQINGVPEFIAQLLDKLISNAIDFHENNTAIVTSITKTDESIILSVCNIGPCLPVAMQSNLFESMVSVREGESSETHLGLGLYIVRLISQFHNADVIASNLENNNGVIFEVIIFHHNSSLNNHSP
ncbi:MAG: proteobacterial dedicated sortase system histidine kinase [Gammaproteobacteria bacterium]